MGPGGGGTAGGNKAAVAVARKLAVAVWHVLMGRVIGALEPLARRQAKLFKLATEIGGPAIKAAGHMSWMTNGSMDSKGGTARTTKLSGLGRAMRSP